MNLIIHRGARQIGGSCIELFTENTRIILDAGQELPVLNDEKTKIATELPKVEGLYTDNSKKIDAILISHGHGDHAGLLKYVNPQIPVFIGEKAFKILNVTAQFTRGKTIANPVNYLISGQKIVIGDFSVTPYLVDHSGFDSYAFVIKDNNKCIVYTGDFRDHGRKKKATDYFRKNITKDVHLLLIEGTMMSRLDEEIETEQQIEEKAYQFMMDKDTPVFVLQSAANIDRLVGMYKAVKSSKRMFVIDIFTAHVVSQLGGSVPRPGQFKDIRVFYPYYLTERMCKEPGGKELMKQFSRYRISKEELGGKKDYCMLIRDTMLADIERIDGLTGAGLIYSMWNGYKKTLRLKRLLDYATSKGMEVIDLHTSGHASMQTIQQIVKDSDPKRIIPIHTDRPEKFALMFDNVYLAKDNECIGI